MAFVRLAAYEELWDGEMQSCVVDGRKVLLLRVGHDIYAYENRCAHLGAALSEGTLEKCVLTCSAHHYQYDVCTGHGINPKAMSLVSFPVRVDDGDIFVDVAPGRGR